MSANAQNLNVAGLGAGSNDKILKTLAVSGTSVSSRVDCRGLRCVRFQLKTGATTNTPVGKFQLQGSEDRDAVYADEARSLYGTGNEVAQWTTLTLPDGSVHGTNGAATAFAGPSTDITTDGSAVLNFIVDVVDPPAFLRLAYVRTSGGGSSTNFRCIAGVREL
jgi:hypothetical protein